MRLIRNTKADVVLLGREREGDENLALRYLAAALEKAGHRPHIIPLCGLPDFPGVADVIPARASQTPPGHRFHDPPWGRGACR